MFRAVCTQLMGVQQKRTWVESHEQHLESVLPFLFLCGSNSDGLQPNNNGLQPASDGLHPACVCMPVPKNTYMYSILATVRQKEKPADFHSNRPTSSGTGLWGSELEH